MLPQVSQRHNNSSRSNRDKEGLATAEFFPHRDNRLRKQNPSKKKNKGSGSAWKILPGTTRTDRQIDTTVALIYKIDLKPPFWGY